MRKGYKAVRVEIPEELHERFKKQIKRNYKTISSFLKDCIVQYVRDCENE